MVVNRCGPGVNASGRCGKAGTRGLAAGGADRRRRQGGRVHPDGRSGEGERCRRLRPTYGTCGRSATASPPSGRTSEKTERRPTKPPACRSRRCRRRTLRGRSALELLLNRQDVESDEAAFRLIPPSLPERWRRPYHGHECREPTSRPSRGVFERFVVVPEDYLDAGSKRWSFCAASNALEREGSRGKSASRGLPAHMLLRSSSIESYANRLEMDSRALGLSEQDALS